MNKFLTSTVASVPDYFPATIPPKVIEAEMSSTSTEAITVFPFVKSVHPIFLQTKTAQGLACAFVGAALFLTCQQVSMNRFVF